MLKCPPRVKSKSLRTLQRQLMEIEDTGEERVEMNNLEVTVEDKDHNANDSSNTGKFISIDLTFSVV